VPVVTTTSTARTNFYANESWWGQQRKRAKSIIYQTTPYSCAKLAKVLELRNPHFYYFVNGPQNCQVRNKIEFIIQPDGNKLNLTSNSFIQPPNY
jgi:hypothetical protein